MKSNLTKIRLCLFGLLALLALLCMGSCTTSDTEGDQYLTWSLSPSLSEYDSVTIVLVKSGDTNVVLERVFAGKLSDPVNFPKYKLGEAKGKDFTIQIRAYNKNHELILAKDVDVKSKTASPTKVLQADMRLFLLSSATGTLKPAFDPAVYGYSIDLADTAASVKFTVFPMDVTNTLSLNNQAQAWGPLPVQTLEKGDNFYSFTVASKDGKVSKLYQVAVTRGAPSVIDTSTKLESLVIQPKSLRIFVGDPSTIMSATAVPAQSRMQWSSLNTGVAKVDRFGNVTAVEAGTTQIIVQAGDKADTASVQVVRDAPVVSVGGNLAVKKGTEVGFRISVTQEHGTIVAFKYDLDGDDVWDNADSSRVVDSLKHVYGAVKTYTAKFYVRDSEGNVVIAARTINVTDEALLVSIIWPGRDTILNITPLTVRYTVDNGPELSKEFPLNEGVNSLTVDAVNGADKGSAKIKITLDTKAPVVSITSPVNGTLTRESSLPVAWKVDGVAQSTQLSEDLGTTEGERSIVRESRDSAGNVGHDTVRVTRDSKGPLAPKVTGATPTNAQPRWMWTTGGGGGSGVFRFQLGSGEFPASVAESKDTVYALVAPALSGTKYTLYVEERDAAGNWSPASSLEILFDTSTPVVGILAPQASGTYVTRAGLITLSGTTGGPNAVATVTYKVNGADKGAATFASGTWTIQDLAVAEGVKTVVTVVCTDAVGNHGESALTILRDTTAPGAPTLGATPATPTGLGKGTWSWSAGSDGTNGSGLNGKYRHALNGGAWTELSATSVSDLVLIEGSNTFAVQEQDAAGNWSASATHKVVSDRTGPVVKITSHVSPASSSSTRITLSGTVADSGSGVQTVVITGQQSGSGAAVITGGTWAGGEVVLGQGANTLTVTATDKVGNPSTAILAVSVNVNAPTVSITSPLPNAITGKDTITVKYKSNGKDTLKQFTLSEGSNTLTVYTPPNEIGVTGSASVVVIKDATPPNAPTLAASKALTKDDPVWNWSSNGDVAGGGGVNTPGTFQYSLNDGAFTAITALTFTMASATDGVKSLAVREVDKAGNVSAASTKVSITVDKTAPVVVITYPADGFVTNKSSLTVNYTDAGVAKSSPAITLGNDNGVPNTVTITSAPDGAGNVGTKSITVYLRSNVRFVKPGGTGTGSSWADASGAIQPALDASASGQQVWVMGGAGVTYASDATADGFVIKSGVSLYGSFNGTENSTSGRSFTAATNTILSNTSGNTVTLSAKTNVTIDGFEIQYPYRDGVDMFNSSGIAINNCNIAHVLLTGSAIYVGNSSFSCTNTKFTKHGFEAAAIHGDGGTATFTNCEFSGNSYAAASYAKMVELDFDYITFTGTHFKDVHSYPENREIIATKVGGSLTVNGCYFTVANIDAAVTNETLNATVTTVPNLFNQ
ncbi:MAG: hypothetical protein JWO30_428 [Fibrobacteres bacterium]|nr:hypothetical protein [Fibrobacterota bacterium]